MARKLFTPAQAAEWLGLSLKTVRQYARSNPPRLNRDQATWDEHQRLRFTLAELKRSRAALQRRGPKPGKPQKRAGKKV